jgi:mRNA-degrading endonuclease RelE of RelBE toxin-antitoxin system
MRVLLHPNAAKELKKLDAKTRERIKEKIRMLGENPEAGKRLVPSRFLSLRAGDYRAIYELDAEKKRAIVLLIGHRKGIYIDFNKLF